MKIVHINATDSLGGAAIAAFRHCEAMREAGLDAEMLVLVHEKKSVPYVHSIIANGKWAKIKSVLINQIMRFLLMPFHPWAVFSFPFLSVSVAKHPLIKEADLIYIHWVAGSMLSTREIERVLKLGKPVRWYMHDMNPVTGGCHHAMDCEQYKTECKNCPFLRTHPLGLDLAFRQFKVRMKRWSVYANLEAYTPSAWLGKCVMESALWKNHKVTVFPNVFDLKKFHPGNRQAAREFLGVGKEHKLVLFGAAGVDDEYKGWRYMREALNQLSSASYEALIFGEENSHVKEDLKISCRFTGFLHDEYSLILVYNAADVFVSASLADNYPNVIMEAMACGLPCVGFNVGGVPEQIRHKENGYLAELKDSGSLAEGIRYVCESSVEEYQNMQKKAFDFVRDVASYERYK